MAIKFEPPPDWLIQQYMNQPNPVVEGLNATSQIMQQYQAQKAQQQQQAIQQQQLAMLQSKEAREGREGFYNYGDTAGLPQDVQSQLGQPAQGPTTPGGMPPGPSPLIQRYNEFLQKNPQGIKGQTMTEDMLYVKDPATGSLTPSGTSQRPIKGKTIISGPNASQNSMDFNMNRPRYIPDLKTPEGMPMEYTPSQGLAPARVQGGMKPVASKGDESAIGDATLLANQIPNIKKMFDAYRSKGELGARAQSTGLGSVLDPEAKQAENSLKLAAFTFGGKQLTGQEKKVVFDALFPTWTDNDPSRDAKETILTDFMNGKIDLLEAANLLGPSAKPLREMLDRLQSRSGGQTFTKPEEEDEYQAYKNSLQGGK